MQIKPGSSKQLSPHSSHIIVSFRESNSKMNILRFGCWRRPSRTMKRRYATIRYNTLRYDTAHDGNITAPVWWIYLTGCHSTIYCTVVWKESPAENLINGLFVQMCFVSTLPSDDKLVRNQDQDQDQDERVNRQLSTLVNLPVLAKKNTSTRKKKNNMISYNVELSLG